MVLLISALAKIGATKPIFLDSGSPGGEGGVHVCVGMVCYHCIVNILNSSKNYFLCLQQRFVQSYAVKLLEKIFLCFVPN